MDDRDEPEPASSEIFGQKVVMWGKDTCYVAGREYHHNSDGYWQLVFRPGLEVTGYFYVPVPIRQPDDIARAIEAYQEHARQDSLRSSGLHRRGRNR